MSPNQGVKGKQSRGVITRTLLRRDVRWGLQAWGVSWTDGSSSIYDEKAPAWQQYARRGLARSTTTAAAAAVGGVVERANWYVVDWKFESGDSRNEGEDV